MVYGFVYACTNERGSLHLYGMCFVGKYFVVYVSTTKILTPEKYPLYGIYYILDTALQEEERYTIQRENLASIKSGENEKKPGHELISEKFKFGAVAISVRVWVLRVTSCAKLNLPIFFNSPN